MKDFVPCQKLHNEKAHHCMAYYYNDTLPVLSYILPCYDWLICTACVYYANDEAHLFVGCKAVDLSTQLFASFYELE